jgi:hypothetical protein
MKTKEPILTDSLRDAIKEIMQQEIKKIPEQLDKLQAKERLEILLKLMPFVFPKVEAISSDQGEPVNWNL